MKSIYPEIWPPFLGLDEVQSKAFLESPDVKQISLHITSQIEKLRDTEDPRSDWEHLITCLGASMRAMCDEDLNRTGLYMFYVGALVSRLMYDKDTTQVVDYASLQDQYLDKIVANRKKRGISKHQQSGNAELRRQARQEWPGWKPSAGRKTKSAYYRYFYAMHERPADLSTMYRWLS